jgi:hypothetical protein
MTKSIFLCGSLLCLSGFACALPAFGQDPAPPPPPPPVEKTQLEEQNSTDPCPKISLKGPGGPVREGLPVRLSASMVGGDKKITPMFDWSISAGVIRSGQGTATIEIDTDGAGRDRSIYATLLIGGYSGECASSENVVVSIAPPAKIVDEFGTLPDEELVKRIESFVGSIPPGDSLHIIAYAGRNNVRGYASATLRQMRTAVLKTGIPGERLATVDGGYREQPAFEFWLVPAGAEPPTPSPSVRAKDIVFPKAATTAVKPKKP